MKIKTDTPFKIIVNEIPENWTGFVGMDIEKFDQQLGKLHRPHGKFASIQLCNNPKEVYVITDPELLQNAIDAVDNCTWVLHNALYDLRQLRSEVKIEPRFIWDTMLVEQSQKGGYYQKFSLKDLTRRWLGIVSDKDTRADFENATEMTKEMIIYGAYDAYYTLLIAQLQQEEYEDLPTFKTYTEIDEPMIFPILDARGMKVDTERWLEAVSEFKRIGEEIEDEIGVNVYSPQQVKKGAKLHGIHLNDTQAQTLQEYAEYEFIAKVIEARMYRKAVSTYGEDWITKFVEEDGKVYPELKITGAETGRMSSANPNIMQIPSRRLPIYREFFMADDEDTVVVVSDVSQQEPRILGYESKDPVLLLALKNKEDLHLTVAKAAFEDNTLTKEHDKEKRAIGKMINLGTSYGLTPNGLSQKTDLSLPQAEKLIEKYFKRFSGVRAWISAQQNFAYKNGFVQTAHGRRIYLNTYNGQYKNNAINAPIQGGAADFTKMWIRLYWEACRNQNVPYAFCYPVHDELVLVVKKRFLKETLQALEWAFFETAKTLYPDIPFAADTVYGKSWAEKK